MNVKEIIRPEVRETFFYGRILSWKFNDSIVYIKSRNKYCYRVTLTFSSGEQISYQKGGFTSKSEAIKAQEVAISQLYNHTFVPYDYTAGEFFDYWLYYYMVDEKDIAYGTFTSYRNILYNYFSKVIGKKYLQSITKEDLVSCLDTIKSPNVLRIAYGVLAGAFKFAYVNGYISRDLSRATISFHKIKQKKNKNGCAKQRKKTFKKKLADQTNVYTVSQVSKLLYVCKKEEPSIFIAMLFAVTAGLRISETIAVKYSNIDFLNNKLYVENQLGRTITNEGIPGETLLTQEKRTKTHNSVREVPLADFVIDEIILQRQHYNSLKQYLGEDFHDLGYIICQDNGLPWHRNFKNKAYKRVVDKCGFKYIEWRKLRTTYASILSEYNVSMKAISMSLGHYSADFTKDVYVKSQMKIIDVATLIDPYINQVLSSDSQKLQPIDLPDVSTYFGQVSLSS